jgi:DNA-binding protein HU-beta
MNKLTLTKEVAKVTGFTQKKSKVLIEATMKAISEALIAGDKVKIANFGTFDTYERKERNGVNPQTREKMVIPAKTVVRYKAAKAFNALVNDEEVEAEVENTEEAEEVEA